MANQFNDTAKGLLEGRVQIKSNKTGDIASRAKRIVSGSPEVMVKVTGNAKGAGHVKSHLDYISRNGKLELENERGEILKGKDSLKQVSKEWNQDKGKRNANTRDTTNIVLSMPKGTDPKGVKDAARAFAKKRFGENYQYVFALHTDADHPHVHLTVKTLGFDGKRLHVKKGDPQRWREGFAEELLRRGIDAEATPRAPRGVIKKPVKQVIKHIREKGFTPTVDVEKIREIVGEFREIQQKGQSKPKPWEAKIAERQKGVRQGWLEAAKALNEGDDADRLLAKNIVSFVKAMPPMTTERHELAKKLSQHVSKQELQRGNETKDVRSQDDQER